MNVDRETMEKKVEVVTKMLQSDPSLSNATLQQTLKKKFGSGMSSEKYAKIRRNLADLRNRKSSVRPQTTEPRAHKETKEVKEDKDQQTKNGQSTSRPATPAIHVIDATRSDVAVGKQVEDLVRYMKTAIPGLRRISVTINDQGNCAVEYDVVHHVTGTTEVKTQA